jgi:hypothetical protein
MTARQAPVGGHTVPAPAPVRPWSLTLPPPATGTPASDHTPSTPPLPFDVGTRAYLPPPPGFPSIDIGRTAHLLTPAQVTAAEEAKPAFSLAWVHPVTLGGPRYLAVTPLRVVMAGNDEPMAAFAIADGTPAWTAPVKASAPLAVLDRVVYATTETSLVAVDAPTGVVRWTTAVDEAPSPAAGPLAVDGRVIVSTATSVRAYRAVDGVEIWRQDVGSPALVPLAGGVNAVIAVLGDHSLAAFDLATGALNWRVPLGMTPTGLVANGDRVYFGTIEGPACAYHQDNGQKDWCYRVRVPSVGAPALDDRLVYMTFLDNTVRLFDRGNGAMRRVDILPRRPFAGPALTAPAEMLVPLVTDEVFALSRAAAPSPTAKPPRPAIVDQPQPSASLQALALTPDGGWMALVTVSPVDRALVVYRHKVR